MICDAFIERMSGRQESVVVQLRSELRDTIQKNRQKLHSIVETIVLCGRQNLALRGHRDGKVYSQQAETMATLGLC